MQPTTIWKIEKVTVLPAGIVPDELGEKIHLPVRVLYGLNFNIENQKALLRKLTVVAHNFRGITKVFPKSQSPSQRVSDRSVLEVKFDSSITHEQATAIAHQFRTAAQTVIDPEGIESRTPVFSSQRR